MINEQFTRIKSQVVELTTANKPYLIPSYPLLERKTLIIHNTTDEIIYVGGSDLNNENGLPIKSGDYFITSLSNNVYALCGTDGQQIRIVELG